MMEKNFGLLSVYISILKLYVCIRVLEMLDMYVVFELPVKNKIYGHAFTGLLPWSIDRLVVHFEIHINKAVFIIFIIINLLLV